MAHEKHRQRQKAKRDDRGAHVEAEYDDGLVRIWDPVQKVWSAEERAPFPSKKGGKDKK